MVNRDDWRLRNQRNWLQRARLRQARYRLFREGWDHDHCEFCGDKFCLDATDCLHEGYCTLDWYHWICVPCFEDFREMFEFEVVE
jgi:hypothetical protein